MEHEAVTHAVMSASRRDLIGSFNGFDLPLYIHIWCSTSPQRADQDLQTMLIQFPLDAFQTGILKINKKKEMWSVFIWTSAIWCSESVNHQQRTSQIMKQQKNHN